MVTEPVHLAVAPHENEHVAPFGHVTEQSSHAPPPAPHAAWTVPGWHVVPPQHPPLHGDVLLQVVEHAPPLQALPARQSDSDAQPQAPPLRHAEPFLPEQEVHVPPAVPHAPGAAPGWHVVPSQQPPLH
jgi:hypothetical protein